MSSARTHTVCYLTPLNSLQHTTQQKEQSSTLRLRELFYIAEIVELAHRVNFPTDNPTHNIHDMFNIISAARAAVTRFYSDRCGCIPSVMLGGSCRDMGPLTERTPKAYLQSANDHGCTLKHARRAAGASICGITRRETTYSPPKNNFHRIPP